jgi:hypothetical protein
MLNSVANYTTAAGAQRVTAHMLYEMACAKQARSARVCAVRRARMVAGWRSLYRMR